MRRRRRAIPSARPAPQHEPRRQTLLDNAKAERFMRTLKEEEVNGKTYGCSKTPANASAPLTHYL